MLISIKQAWDAYKEELMKSPFGPPSTKQLESDRILFYTAATTIVLMLKSMHDEKVPVSVGAGVMLTLTLETKEFLGEMNKLAEQLRSLN